MNVVIAKFMHTNRLKMNMESRIHGDVYVRFGGEYVETCRLKGRQGATCLACVTENVAATTSNMEDELTNEVQSPPNPQKRISGKQRKATLEEYQQTFLQVPRIDDRKPVFVSSDVRDRLDRVVRILGGRRMSVSGIIENIVRHHLSLYEEDFEAWRKL